MNGSRAGLAGFVKGPDAEARCAHCTNATRSAVTAPKAGLEPATYGLEGRCSIH